MAANTSPIFGLTPNTQTGQTIATQNTAKDGTGTVVTGFTAGANGSLVEQIHFMPIGTNVVTVARIFINNGLLSSTPGNNSFYDDITLAASTLNESGSMGVVTYIFKVNGMPRPLNLPGGYKLNFTIGATVSAGYAIQVVGADF